MVYRVVLQQQARQELRAATAYYAQLHPTIGAGFVEAFEKIIQRLSGNPLQFAYFDPPLRKAVFPRHFPYSVLLMVEEDVVKVFSLFNHRRKPQNWLQ